jgi:hypothetical protein
MFTVIIDTIFKLVIFAALLYLLVGLTGFIIMGFVYVWNTGIIQAAFLALLIAGVLVGIIAMVRSISAKLQWGTNDE